jgi:hypothetical protein
LLDEGDHVKRRTLDIILAGGGLMVGVLILILGFAVASQYSFAQNYVKEELGAQKIVFAPAANLTDAEKNWQPGSTCLTTYAGQTLETGAQAQCYAKYYIREHMKSSAESAGFPGATYATLGSIRTDLTAQVTAAKAKGDTSGAADIQKKFDAATSLRTTMQTGETLSGLLLTVYGFSVVGDIAGLAGNVLYGLGAIMAFISVAGFVHAFVTPKEKVIFGQVGERVRIPTTA